MTSAQTPQVSGPTLETIKRRAYGLALGIAGLASLVEFLLSAGTESESLRWAFGPGVALICFAFGFVFTIRAIPVRRLEKAAVAVAWLFILLRAAIGLFALEDGALVATDAPEFGSWMTTGFIFTFVALRTRDALPMTLVLYAALASLGAIYVLVRGIADVPSPVLNRIVQELLVTNAFAITFLYFLARTKEELSRERTERLLMARLAHTDELTTLPNRRFILQSLQRAILRADRDDTGVSLILFDLDRFKTVNDTYGHATGDAVLRRAALLARELLRSSDEIGRFGGEEFLVVAFGTDVDSVAQLAERLRTGFESHRTEGEPPFTASFGVASHRRGEPLTSLLARTDDALYAAKSRGRNRVVRDVELGLPVITEGAPTAAP